MSPRVKRWLAKARAYMNKSLATLACLLVVSWSAADACSFPLGYGLFELSPRAQPFTGEKPSAPVAHVASMKRGFDDGNYASCSDAAVLTIVLAQGERDRNIGYLFSIESGSLHDMKMPGEIITPTELADGELGFFFVWLDYGTAFSATLSIRSVSPTGLEGDAIVLEIEGD